MVIVPPGYAHFLSDLKSRVRVYLGQRQLEQTVDQERLLIPLYWNIGRAILAEEKRACWGNKDIDRLARDLKREFPDVSGFAPYNFHSMRHFAHEWPDESFVREVAAQVPWLHNRIVLDNIQEAPLRAFYLRKTLENHWTRTELKRHIIGNFHNHFSSSWDRTSPQIEPEAHSHAQTSQADIQSELLTYLKTFFLQRGQGLAFVGSPYLIQQRSARQEKEDKDSRRQSVHLDLLFYHLKGRCFVVVSLKNHAFQPTFVEEMNFFLLLCDERLQHASDAPAVGLVVCYEAPEHPVEIHAVLRGTEVSLGPSNVELAQALQLEIRRLRSEQKPLPQSELSSDSQGAG